MKKFAILLSPLLLFAICLHAQEYTPDPGYDSGSGSAPGPEPASGSEYTPGPESASGSEYTSGAGYDPGALLPHVENWVENGVAMFNSVKRDTVLKNFQMKTYFKWADSSETVLYFIYRNASETPGLVCGDNISERVKLVFDGNDLSSITMMAYCLNVNEFMLEDKFDREVKTVKDWITKAVPDVEPVSQKVKAYSRLKIKRLVWTGKDLTYVLTYASRMAKPRESIYQAYFADYANFILHRGNKKIKKSEPKKKEKKEKAPAANAPKEEDPKEKKEKEKLKKKDMFIPGYVELKICRTPAPEKGKKEQSADKKKESVRKDSVKYADHVKKNDDKDVYIEGIPMVDQGDSPLASCAIMERLVRYYFGEQDVDQYDLQLSIKEIFEKEREKEREKEKDKNKKNVPLPPVNPNRLRGMSEVVAKALSHKFMCNLKIYYDFPPNNLSNLKQIIKDYNVQAEKDKRDFIDLVKVKQNPNEEGPKVVSIEGTLKRMKYVGYVAMRQNEKELKEAFFKTIKEQIDLGYPVVWNVNQGIMPTYDGKKPANFAYERYCRLIIGYNESKSLIYYSETRGPDSEKLSVSLDDAWPLTIGYLSITPK